MWAFTPILYEGCSCSPGEIYPDGNKPEWFKDIAQAFNAWRGYHINNQLYWGIHLKGKHVLGFHVPGVCRCYSCQELCGGEDAVQAALS